MTYNWNTMVEITVPTGTNGWLYSGEVIINGVKVRFPVGVPTSVPEPAAVLLKKMIELEQEEDANTAKPQNHYVGDVTIPAGKTLTLEKGAKFVDNSGGGEVVILPETELFTAEVVPGENGIYNIMDTPIENTPIAGATGKLVWGGVEYTSKIMDISAMMGLPDGSYFCMGNLAVMGEVPPDMAHLNPAPDAPYMLMFLPDGMPTDAGTTYGQMMSLGITPEPPTLSIVQVGAASGGENAGGEAMVLTARGAIADGNTVTLDKSYDELVAAYKAGKLVKVLLTNGGMLLTLCACNLNQDGQHNDRMTFTLYLPSSSGAMWAVITYDNVTGNIKYEGGYQ